MSLIRGEQISGSVASASYALTASYALNAGFNTGSFVLTSSFNTFTSSYYVASASFSANINSLTAATSSYVQNSQTSSMSVLSSSYALTASLAPNYLPLTGGTINGNVVLNGTASIAFLNVTYESASVIYSSGSNQFGDATNDTQTLIGRVIVSGGLEVTGSVFANVTGSLLGTSSWANSASNASSSSYALSSSFAVSASWAPTQTIDTGSLVTTSSFNAFTSSYNTGSFTGSFVGSLVGTSSWADNATSSSYALTASFVTGSDVYGPYGANSVISASYASTASFSLATTENRVLVMNKSGATITKGMVVHLTGSNNSSDTPYIITASYESDSLSANTLGIASQTIAFNSTGYITTEGVITGVDVTGFVSGQVLYLGSAGSIIGTAPLAPLHSVRLGQVVRDSPSNNGSIYVRIDNGYELGELHDVLDTTTTSSYGDLLIKSGSVWTSSKTLSGSYILSGSLTTNDGVSVQTLTASFVSASGGITGSLLGTATTASYVTGSIFTNNNVAASASYAAISVYPITVTGSSIYSTGPSTGNVSANNGIFLGGSAGGGATSANLSVFLGYLAGQLATSANESIIIGPAAGLEASKADHSVFVGSGAGYKAVSASYSIIIGSYAGSAGDITPSAVSVGTNNILIGNYVTLPSRSRDSINIGGIIFATGSYSNMGTTYSGSQYNIGRVGINKVTPEYTLDVSGSGNYSNGLTVTGSLRAGSGITGSLSGTATTASYVTGSIFTGNNIATSASYALTASYALNGGGGGGGSTFPYNGNAVITGSLLVSGSGLTVTGSLKVTSGITGSLLGTASTASYYAESDPVYTAAVGNIAFLNNNNSFSNTQTIDSPTIKEISLQLTNTKGSATVSSRIGNHYQLVFATTDVDLIAWDINQYPHRSIFIKYIITNQYYGMRAGSLTAVSDRIQNGTSIDWTETATNNINTDTDLLSFYFVNNSGTNQNILYAKNDDVVDYEIYLEYTLL